MWHELLFCVYRSEIISVKMRTYKRRVGARKYADYLNENLQKAVDDVKGGKLTVREAAVKYGIPKSTVSR